LLVTLRVLDAAAAERRYVGCANVTEESVSVGVRDGFLQSFAVPFLEAFGAESLFARTLSDYLTMGLARMLIAKGRLSENDPVALFSDTDAIEVLSSLGRSYPSLKTLFLQEPLGYVPLGAIEQSFDTLFGSSRFLAWLEAFERRAFESCRALTTQPS
jgi:hypothetical protein